VHVALITHKFVRGDGQGRVNYEIARAALAAGHDVWLVANAVAPELAAHPRARVVRFDVGTWPSALLQNQVFAARTALWLRRHRKDLDVVHANGFVTWGRTDVSTAHFVHAAWLRSPHHTANLRSDWYGRYQRLYTWCGALLEAWSYSAARIVVGVSVQVRRELAAAGVDPARLRVIPNGVDVDEFAPGGGTRAALGMPDGVVLLFVGDIKTPRKNLDTLVRALASVPHCTLAVVGDTKGSPYPKLARELGVADRVAFLGYRRDVPALMRAADVFVFPSRYEACSLVLLEAAASGLPVIAGRRTGGAELLDGECGVLLDDVEDAGELAAALRRVVGSAEVRAQMGAAARRAAERYTWAAMATEYLAIYRELRTPALRPAAEARCEVS
jgi:glycosyltransferase involved in cell wall biosynthesis